MDQRSTKMQRAISFTFRDTDVDFYIIEAAAQQPRA